MAGVRSVIVGTGRHVPENVVANSAFAHHRFHARDGRALEAAPSHVLHQFEAITGIRERRWAEPGRVASDLAVDAARRALDDAALDPETLDAVVVAHNFGDVKEGSTQVDAVPSLAARVKHRLGIRNPRSVAFDLVFGCPGWLQAVILVDGLMRAGEMRRALVIGAETLSRVSDPHDRDSLLYADGAGAAVLEARADTDGGILARAARSDVDECAILGVGPSCGPGPADARYIKMEGRRVYRYALSTVPPAIKGVLEDAGLGLDDVSKVLLHQANGKMIEAILAALVELCGSAPRPDLLPTTISFLGNSSVATLPTLLDLMRRGELGDHRIAPGDNLVLGAVGAGMHVNAIVYREPS